MSSTAIPVRLDRSAHARDFLTTSESWLLEAEPENNLILGVARRFAGEPDTSLYWATLTDRGRVVGAAFRTPPHMLALTAMPPAAIALLAADVATAFGELPGVTGPAREAELFAASWTERWGGAWRAKIRQRIHVLTAVEPIAAWPRGMLRRMASADVPLITEWMRAFVEEVGVIGPVERIVRPIAERRSFYFWDDDGARSIVAAARETPRGACVNAVYTPPIFRGRGYATAAVATLTENLLASGKEFCCLYTDAANPTSNSIYRKIGYRPIRDDVEIVFEGC